MPNYLNIFQKAFDNYTQQVDRTHPSLDDVVPKPIYGFGLFSKLRHSQTKYPALISLEQKLLSASESEALQAIKAHFNDKNNQWHNHSFNNYLLDELKRQDTPLNWLSHWQSFDPKPICYYQGFLFRGTGDLPSRVFVQGFHDKKSSTHLDDYIRSSSLSIGISTSKLFYVAQGYALPPIRLGATREFFIDVWTESYLYIIDYDKKLGVDLEATFRARGQTIAAYFSGKQEGKAEVNVINRIPAENIVGAFYLNRRGDVRWMANNNYIHQNNPDKYSELKTVIPSNFMNSILNPFNFTARKYGS